jgi:AraC-like DNA-binding protein
MVYTTSSSGVHFHNCLEVGYCHDGKGIMTYAREQRDYCSKTFSIIPPNFIHTTDSLNGRKCSWEYLFIDVDGALNEFFPENQYIRDVLSRMINHGYMLSQHEENPQTANLILAMMDELRIKSEFYQESVRGLLRAFLISAARMCGESHSAGNVSTTDSDVGAIVAAIKHVAAHYAEKIKISDLSDACHLSETHFRRVFVSIMNISPLDYVNRIRVEAACKLLATTNHTIGDIAVKSGFVTITALNRNFKDIMEETPSQWRKGGQWRYGRNKSFTQPYEGWL